MNKNRVLIELSESPRTKFGKEDFAAQSLPQKVFSTIWSLESEVNNGGFVQYFQNSSGETAPFAVQALESIGAPQTAGICERAIARAFSNGLPKTAEEIALAAQTIGSEAIEDLERLDAEFMAYPHDLTELLFDYVSKHPGEFGPVPYE